MHRDDLHHFIEGTTYRIISYQGITREFFFLLKRRAEAEHRSIAQEAIVLLAKGLDTSIAPKERRTRLLQRIEEEAEINSETAAKLDPVELIREDRKR